MEDRDYDAKDEWRAWRAKDENRDDAMRQHLNSLTLEHTVDTPRRPWEAMTSGKSQEPGLAGWRSSADGPLLRPFSLLTGNFTGNFAKSRLRGRQRQ